MEIKVVIPSMGRATTIFTHKYVSNCIICVPESEKHTYQQANPNNEILTHPDNIKGLGAKRQWIIEKFKSVFMIDDDIKGFTRLTQKKGETSAVSPDLAYYIIQHAANVSQMMGSYIFSFNNLIRPEWYSGHIPYTASGAFFESAFGILEGADKLIYNPEITTNYEFYISGLNAYYYRKCFIDKRFGVLQDGFGEQTGGASNYRTLETEKKDLEILKRFFGKAIQTKASRGKMGKHEFSKNFIIPF